MKTMMLLLFLAACAAAQDRPAGAAPSAKPAAAADTATSLPKGAIEIEPNLYRFTDSHGKTWLARQTPFGLSRWEDKPAAPAPAVPSDTKPQVTVTDLGDKVGFTSKSPFGGSTWIRRKSELTDEEKDWLARAVASNSLERPKSAQPAGDAAEKR